MGASPERTSAQASEISTTRSAGRSSPTAGSRRASVSAS